MNVYVNLGTVVSLFMVTTCDLLISAPLSEWLLHMCALACVYCVYVCLCVSVCVHAVCVRVY